MIPLSLCFNACIPCAYAKYLDFFVKDTAEFEQFEDFEPVTNLTADEAIN